MPRPFTGASTFGPVSLQHGFHEPHPPQRSTHRADAPRIAAPSPLKDF
jgi:hypothetical protein